MDYTLCDYDNDNATSDIFGEVGYQTCSCNAGYLHPDFNLYEGACAVDNTCLPIPAGYPCVYPDSFLNTLNTINDIFGINIDFESGIKFIQNIKVQIIGFCISSQTMVAGYKDIVQKMKDRDNESFYEVFNEELGKIGS